MSHVAREPVERQPLHLLQCAWLFEQVRGVRHDGEFDWRTHASHRLFVELDHRTVIAADDEEGRRPDNWKRIACEVRPPAAAPVLAPK